MSIKSPTTYGEWYWAQGLEASLAEQETYEQELAPHFRAMLTDVFAIDELDPADRVFLESFVTPTSPVMGGVGLRFASEIADSIVGGAIEPRLRTVRHAAERNALSKILTPAQAVLLKRRKKITDTYADVLFKFGGYPDEQSRYLYQAFEPYPSIPELITYSRYHGDPDNVWTTIQEFYDLDATDRKLWEWLGLQKPTLLQAQNLFKRGVWDESRLATELAQLGWSKEDRSLMRDLGYVLPNPMLLTQGNLQVGASEERILSDISKGDIHPDYAQQYLDAVLTKPASLDLVTYELRKDPSLSNLDQRLKKLGIHPDYFEVYKTLAYQIPPVADIITMAVREAFTPAIAARFGQYEDFPEDFAKYAAMKGLDEEWAKRYWAAHWSLPSPQQGFQMLHRGVIDRPQLDMLLRALDVMPFWRDKLTQIAYRPLTRVDVRRMYKQGVLSEAEVFESYLDQGYAEENARRMAEFTVKQTLASLSKFTSGDIVKAFAGRMITAGDAKSLLRSIGIRDEDAQYIVSTAEYKRQWAFTDQQIAGIRNLYKKRVYNADQTRDKLGRLNLPSDQVNVLMEQWHYDKIEELDATWTTTQVLKFLGDGLITRERAKRELFLNGYDAEHIDVYLRSIK